MTEKEKYPNNVKIFGTFLDFSQPCYHISCEKNGNLLATPVDIWTYTQAMYEQQGDKTNCLLEINNWFFGKCPIDTLINTNTQINDTQRFLLKKLKKEHTAKKVKFLPPYMFNNGGKNKDDKTTSIMIDREKNILYFVTYNNNKKEAVYLPDSPVVRMLHPISKYSVVVSDALAFKKVMNEHRKDFSELFMIAATEYKKKSIENGSWSKWSEMEANKLAASITQSKMDTLLYMAELQNEFDKSKRELIEDTATSKELTKFGYSLLDLSDKIRNVASLLKTAERANKEK